MIIRNVSELRLYFPTHNFDSTVAFSGNVHSSELDFLKEKLGASLYNKLNAKLALINSNDFIDHIEQEAQLSYYENLLNMCQRCVAYDAMGRMASINAISINNTGINVATSQDYKDADKKAIDDFKSSCAKESHISVNILLATLEEWAIDAITNDDADLKDIVDAWKTSKYYFCTSSLFIPSATILQDYLNFYENREKFILMLPDLKYIQEEMIESVIGSKLSAYLLKEVSNDTKNEVSLALIKMLRKFMAANLEARTQILKISESRVMKAHDEAVAYETKITKYLTDNLDSLLASTDVDLVAAIKTTPVYIKRQEDEAAKLALTEHPKPKEDDALFNPMPPLY